ncbi:hypothetical protein Pelo_18254 [Pelomyxa schiedti]|nr:hypothetical protein Pelo_18254 [Pelomyxa schiedti]
MRVPAVIIMAGRVDSIRWLASTLEIAREDAPWILPKFPLSVALRYGNMDVAACLFEEVGFSNLPSSTLEMELFCCADGKSPSKVKWCADKFSVTLREENVIYQLLTNKHSTVEDCLWMEDYTRHKRGVAPIIFKAIKNVDIAKWVLSISREDSPDTVDELLQSVGDVSLAEWLVTEKHFEPTTHTFELACCTPTKKGSSLARWLSKRVTLSQSDILTSFTKALSQGNVEVAEWMEETFHVMDVANSNPESAGSTITWMCREYPFLEDRDSGLRWFLQHLPHPNGISADSIHTAVSWALDYGRRNEPSYFSEDHWGPERP